MASLHHFLGQQNRLWEPLPASGTDTVDVSEVWQDENPCSSPGQARTCHKSISKTGVDEWLRGTEHQQGSRGSAICRLRIVWVRRLVKHKIDDVASDALLQLVNSFHLELAQQYSASCYSGAARLPSTTETQPFFFCNHPKISMTWSFDRSTGTTSAICIAEENKIDVLKGLLEYPFLQGFLDHQLLVSLLCAVLLSREIDEAQNAIKQQVREVEVRTGFHSWQSRSEAPAVGDLDSLSATMSGCGTRTASLMRKIEVLSELANFAFVQLDANGRDTAGRVDEAVDRRLRAQFETLVHRAKMQRIDAEFFEKRTNTQLTALFHLIAQNDMLISHEIAKDSRLLTLAAQRDSSSMKSLAVVTMFFLPGTFVSSLFSMPLFNWDTDDQARMFDKAFWGPRLSMYLTVTMPLMLFTFAVWGSWLLVQTIQTRKRQDEAHAQLYRGYNVPEVGALARKRESTLKG